MSEEKGTRRAEEIIHLHHRIVGYRGAYPFDRFRDEYLRGWERALRWVMKQETPPTEFIEEEK